MSLTIPALYRSRLHNQEYFIYGRTVVKFLTDAKVPELKVFLPKMEEALNKMDALLKPVASSTRSGSLILPPPSLGGYILKIT